MYLSNQLRYKRAHTYSCSMFVILFDTFFIFFLEVLITERFLLKIAENLGDEYFQLGQLLGVPRPFIKRLENDYPRNTSRVTNEVLSKWRDTSAKRPNEFNMMEELIKALADLDLTEVAEMTRRGECSIDPCHCCDSVA